MMQAIYIPIHSLFTWLYFVVVKVYADFISSTGTAIKECSTLLTVPTHTTRHTFNLDDGTAKAHNDEDDDKHCDMNNEHLSEAVTVTDHDDDETMTEDEADFNDYIDEKRTNYEIKDFDRRCLLGEGQFGQVWLVNEQRKNSTVMSTAYALKVMSKYDLVTSDHVQLILREKDVLCRLRHHPFIVQFHASFHNESFLFLLQEFCQGGELYTLMRQVVQMPEPNVAFYTLCIADALEYMHTQHCIIYRDLKSENIMLDRHGYPKLIDMGYAKVLENENENYKAHTFCGTPKYIAPEMIHIDASTGYTFRVDHWALGILMHEMLFGHHPFDTDDEMTQMELFECICNDECSLTSNDDDVSRDAINLITQLLLKDPTKRLGRTNTGGNSVCDHRFYKNLNIDNLRQKKTLAPYVPKINDSFDTSSFDDWTNTVDDLMTTKFPKLTLKETALFASF
jgi:protein kinase A